MGDPHHAERAPLPLCGWANDSERFHGSALRPLWQNVNAYLARWLMRKYQHLTKRRTQAFREVARLASASPSAFVHWHLGLQCPGLLTPSAKTALKSAGGRAYVLTREPERE